ncbi:hypothetical protein F0U62_33210 [Cystobacter fuscus]|uniref:adventurous gliding motility protein AgmC n=1 Tax=Cystobacter fuscus TaxID=43 RepID=UPI002B2FC5D2|nr:hypothetical protein F0U62_33210 [Cystobacter fuscus]
MNAWLRVVLLSVGLGAMPVLAEEPDSVGLGTGRDGPLAVTEVGQVINRYAQVTGPVAPGDDVLLVADANGFSAGELVMVLQVTGLVPEPSPGMTKPLVIPQDAVGQWEFARLARVGDGALILTKPLVHPYVAQVTQVIRVPEHTHVHVQKGASLRAVPWNGRTGGVVAFLATETLHNEGEISATGAGFRGGSHVPEPFSPMSCMDMAVATRPGAQKGEGVAVTQYGHAKTGRESASNGGGGGVCPMAGGGGGGNGEAGGSGSGSMGLGQDSLDLGGQGGTKLVYSAPTHLVFGGGGGGGHGADWLVPKGGSGGGIVVVRAWETIGNGSVVADGESGEAASAGGAGGGGAGGSISLRFTGSAECGVISARGGAGGAVGANFIDRGGYGGGGGSGRVAFLAGFRGMCSLFIDTGLSGSLLVPAANHVVNQDVDRNQSGFSSREDRAIESLERDCSGYSDDFEIISPDNDSTVSTDGGLVIKGALPNCGDKSVNKVEVNFDDGPVVREEVVLDKRNGKWIVTVKKVPNAEDGGTVEFEHGKTYKISALGSGCTNPKTACPVNFTVDLVPPDFKINPRQGNRTTSNSAGFEFLSTDRDLTFFECALDRADGGVFRECSGARSDIVTVRIGSHTLDVAAFDKSGNKSQQKSEWTVDQDAPDVVIKGPLPDEHLRTKTPLFWGALASSQPIEDGGYVEISVDGRNLGTVVPDSYGYWYFASSSIDAGAGELSNDEHVVSAQVVDDLGNRGDAGESIFVIDTEKPSAYVKEGPSRVVPLRKRKSFFVFSAKQGSSDREEGAVVEFECKVDEESFRPCLASGEFELKNGKHSLWVKAKDKAGNVGGSSEGYVWEVSVDKLPHPSISEPASESILDVVNPTISGQSEPNTKVTIVVDGNPVGNSALVDAKGKWSFQVPFQLEAGRHSLSGVAVLGDTLDGGDEYEPSDPSPETNFVIVVPDGKVSRAIGGGLGCSASSPVSSFVCVLVGVVAACFRRKRRS